MRSSFVLFALFAAGGFAQQPAPSPEIGIIENVAGPEITLNSGTTSVVIHADEHTRVRKGYRECKVSALEPGDDVRIRYGDDGVVDVIWADRIVFSGAITDHGPDRLLVLTNEGSRIVALYPATLCAVNRKYLTEGARIHVVGVDRGNARVDATRITIYNTDQPLRSVR